MLCEPVGRNHWTLVLAPARAAESPRFSLVSRGFCIGAGAVRFWSLPGTGVAPGHPRHEAEVTPVTTEEPQGDARTASAQRLARRGAGNPALDRLAELAARLLRTASAQVSVV